jgi:hypothetical protein
MSGYREFTFGEGDAGVGGKSKPFKADAGRSYRVSFIWWKGLDQGKPDLDQAGPVFVGEDANFIPNVGYVINKGPEYTKLAGGEAPRKRIGSVIVVWPTDKQGSVDKAALSRGDVEILPWIISGDKFVSLKAINKEFPFGQHDFTLNCSDAQFQKMTFTPCRDSLLKALIGNPKAESIVADMIAKAQNISSKIMDHVGREMTISQIREKLAGGGGGGGVSAGPIETMATGDIDSMVDNMLDN